MAKKTINSTGETHGTVRTKINENFTEVYDDLETKVDKEDGKALSAEDYTTLEKEKLAGIDDNANNYTHPASHAGSIITMADAGSYFTGESKTAESVTQEIGATLDEMTSYSTIAAVGDVYTIDFANRPVKNVKIETGDTDPKSIAVSNAPTDAELFIELTYTNAAAITWFEGITWLSGFAPTFTEGKVYRIALFKYGTGWHGNCVGGW